MKSGKRIGFVYHNGELLHEEGENEQQRSGIEWRFYNVDSNMIKQIQPKAYDMTMGMREAKDSLELEGENDMGKLEEMKDEGCQ